MGNPEAVQKETDAAPTVDLQAARELAERGREVLAVSRELNDASSRLLEEIDPQSEGPTP